MTANAALPLPVRLAIAYLITPVLVFLLGWFEWWFAIPLTALILLALAPTLRGGWLAKPDPATLSLLAVATAWVMLSGAGGYFDTNTNADWIKNDAILLDMTRAGWPTLLPDDQPGPDPMLRYYLGYYMVPALAGLGLGPTAMSITLALWTIGGVAVALCLLASRRVPLRLLLLGCLVFIFFSGMDIVRIAIFQDLGALDPGKTHLEWDWKQGLQVQYSSHMVGLLYVPQHFIAGALFSLLLLDSDNRPGFDRISGLLLACAPFWSPFVALGLLPLLLVYLGRRVNQSQVAGLLSWPNLCLSGPLLLVLGAYLTSGETQFKAQWLWEKHSVADLSVWLPVFYLNQFLIISAILIWLDRSLLRNPWFIVANISLAALPWYMFGFFNDLAMRASLPALMLLSVFCVRTLWSWSGSYLRLLPLFIVLCIGSVTGWFEVLRAARLNDNAWRDYAALDYTTLTTVHRFFRAQYKGTNQPAWLLTIMKNQEFVTTMQDEGADDQN